MNGLSEATFQNHHMQIPVELSKFHDRAENRNRKAPYTIRKELKMAMESMQLMD